MFKALQHIKAKSYKLRMNLVDFGGTAQKEQLVYLARGAMLMSERMANPAHSTIIGIPQQKGFLAEGTYSNHAFGHDQRRCVAVPCSDGCAPSSLRCYFVVSLAM